MKFLVVFSVFIAIFQFSKTIVCEQFSLKNKTIFEEAFCQSSCLRNSKPPSCQPPFCKCNDVTLQETELKHVEQNSTTPILLCKQDQSLTFKITPGNFSVAILEIKDENSDWKYCNMSVCDFVVIPGLKQNTSYQVRVSEVDYNGRIFQPQYSTWIKTNPENLIPYSVPQLSSQLIKQNGSVSVSIRWSPAEDMSCYYRLFLSNDNYYDEYFNINPSNFYEIRKGPLQFNTIYRATLISLNFNGRLESNGTSIDFKIPPCLELFFNLTVCPPSKPENLSVDEILTNFTTENNTAIGTVRVNWSSPELLPDYYLVTFLELKEYPNNKQINKTVEGHATRVTFTNIEFDGDYEIIIRAFSPGGRSDAATHSRHLSIKEFNGVQWPETFSEVTLFVMIPLCLLILFVPFLLYCGYYRSKKKRLERRTQYFQELEQMSSAGVEKIENDFQDIPCDEWELDAAKLVLKTVLGEGAFGIVRRGWLTEGDKSTEVAIKMLKDIKNHEEHQQFLKEIEIMKSVGNHPHLVCMIGCVTKTRPDGPLLIVEYCSGGDLQSYLRSVWDRITNSRNEIKFVEMDALNESSGNHFSNKVYEIDDLQKDVLIQPKDLISFARQIAMGMEYLSKLKVLHRDLAARNVLVCDNLTVKVSDFGLSRDVYRDNIYCKRGGGKLPVRWMALESLTHQRYTTQSDVWSFGILLWEIITLGGNPYPGVATKDLLRLLKSGYRMEQPNNCSDELYTLMKSCWKTSVKERPTFTQILETLDVLLQDVSEYIHLDFNNSNKDMSFFVSSKSMIQGKKFGSSERYVRPISGCKY